MRLILIALALSVAVPLHAQSSPTGTEPVQSVTAILAAAPPGTRFGLLAVDDQGREVVAIRPDDRFIPASNTKLFTTAAAYALLASRSGDGEKLLGAGVALAGAAKTPPDVVIAGQGTLSLSTAPDCQRNCWSTLVDWVAGRARTVRNVIADDSVFTDQRWSPGMSWNNIGTDSGTAISALVIDDNELSIEVTPGAMGLQPVVAVSPYYTVVNEAVTVADGPTRLQLDRAVGSRRLRIVGTIAAGPTKWRDLVGIDDPAHFAAWLLARDLKARGVTVKGTLQTIHRPIGKGKGAARPPLREALWLPAAPLGEEISLINKRSQNVHSELLIRRLERSAGIFAALASGPVPVNSLEVGLAQARGVFERAGIPRAGYDFSDGSGMSTYNRISPRATVALLRWGASQPWGREWRASLPIGGVDGTLRRRFVGTPLEGKIWAKTGTLNATNALSGWLQAASGRELTFSIIANDVPDGGNALLAMDTALLALAAAN